MQRIQLVILEGQWSRGIEDMRTGENMTLEIKSRVMKHPRY